MHKHMILKDMIRTRVARMHVKFCSMALIATVGAACGGDPSGPTLRKDVMWDLTVFPSAISLPVGDTHTIAVKPLDYNGAMIDRDVSITYVSGDTSRVVVSPTGVITAVRSTLGQGVGIGITVRAGDVTKRASIAVGVTDGPVDVDSISLRPITGDTVVTIGGTGMVSARAFDSEGREVPNVYIRVEHANYEMNGGIMVYPPLLFATNPGKAMIRATLFVNGKLLSDSVVYTTRYRSTVDVAITRNPAGALNTTFAAMYSTNIYISPNGQATFVNNTTTPVDIAFERPDEVKGSLAGAPGGNIIALPARGRMSRWFPAPGDYFFTVQSGPNSRRVSITVKE